VGVDECKLIELPSVEDSQGNLVFGEGERQVPFAIARVYHVYDVPAGAQRGGHAHRHIEQLVICLEGAFEVEVEDGSRRGSFTLGDPRFGLYLPPLVWHELTGFAAGSAYYVVSSGGYDEAEYVRDYEQFRRLVDSPGESR
jgi:dTDP-4-dehydrorhamnose 3,5-epimerase-like enzyme